MPPRLRTALRFIHRWAGFPAGTVLFILFLTGSLACFAPEIQGWMQPETTLHRPLPGMTPAGLDEAGRQLAARLHKGTFAFLTLPSVRDPVFRLWHYDGHVFLGPALAPDTGLPLPGHDVVGGTFFASLHASLYLPAPWGWGLSMMAGIALLLVLFSGLWLQLRRFLPDLLLFRPQAAQQRRWLDLHLLGGTIGLPVLFIIGLSGVVLQSQKLVHALNPPVRASGHASRHQAHAIITPPHIPDHALAMLARTGRRQWGTTDDGFFMQKGTEIGLYAPDNLHFCLQRQAITPTRPLLPPRSACPTVHSFFIGLHNLRWAGLTTRWLYGLSGLLGCIVIASGMILFLRSEQNSHARQAVTPSISRHLLRCYEALTTATLTGLPLATLALFWSTRLPAPLPPLVWEKGLFFTLWGLALLHGLAGRQARHQQLALLACLGLATPVLDLLTRPLHTGRPLLFLSVDAIACLSGMAGLFLHLRHDRTAPSPPTGKGSGRAAGKTAGKAG